MFDSFIKDFLSGKIYDIIFGILAVVMLYGLSGLFVSSAAMFILRLIVFCFKFPVLLTIRIFKYFCGKQTCILCKTYTTANMFKTKCCSQMLHTECTSKILSNPPTCPNCKLFSDSKFYEIAVYSRLDKLKNS